MDRKMQCMLSFGMLFMLIGLGSTLKCYHCNSHTDKDCKELSGDAYLIDCAEESKKTNLTYTMCRKYDQQIEDDHRIFRDCAVEGSNKCVLRTGTKEIKLEYCECNKDGCNGAGAQSYSLPALILSAAVLYLARS